MPEPRRLWVFGAGGHGRVVADAALEAGDEVLGFVDEARPVTDRVWGLPVSRLEGVESGSLVALGIGDHEVRARVYSRLKEAGFGVATVVHPRAVVARSASVGEGTVVFAGAVVNADARVEAGVIVNTGAVIEHDCVIGEFAHVSPGAALGGGVTVGPRAHVGIGASVLPRIRVGAGARVGGGAAVIRDVGDGETVVGVPAKQV